MGLTFSDDVYTMLDASTLNATKGKLGVWLSDQTPVGHEFEYSTGSGSGFIGGGYFGPGFYNGD